MIDSSTNIKDYIRRYQMLDDDTCTSAVNVLRDSKWAQHSYASGQVETTYSNDLAVTRADIPSVDRAISQSVSEYVSSYKWLPQRMDGRSGTRYQMYLPGTLMRPHVDHIKTLFGGSGGIPILTVLGQLNDTFTGGELMICGEELVLAPGEVIIFPSNFMFPHAVNELHTGERYSFVSWIW